MLVYERRLKQMAGDAKTMANFDGNIFFFPGSITWVTNYVTQLQDK